MSDAILGELDAIRVFVAVAELRSFRAAARLLGIPRSTVSRRIEELEAALDTRLLQRTTRRVNLTDAGETLLARVTPALAAIADAGRDVVDARTEPRGLLRITATPSMGDQLAPVMFALMKRYPDVRVEIVLTDRQVDLVGEGFDIALRAGHLADSTLIARPMGKSRAGYYASVAHLKRAGAPNSLRELRDHDWIVFSGRSRIEDFVIKKRLVASSLAIVREAAVAGFGIAWLPEMMGAEESELVPVLEDVWGPAMPVHLVYSSSRHLAPHVRAAIELILTEIVPTKGQSAPKRPIAPKRPKPKNRAHGKHPVHRSKR